MLDWFWHTSPILDVAALVAILFGVLYFFLDEWFAKRRKLKRPKNETNN